MAKATFREDQHPRGNPGHAGQFKAKARSTASSSAGVGLREQALGGSAMPGPGEEGEMVRTDHTDSGRGGWSMTNRVNGELCDTPDGTAAVREFSRGGKLLYKCHYDGGRRQDPAPDKPAEVEYDGAVGIVMRKFFTDDHCQDPPNGKAAVWARFVGGNVQTTHYQAGNRQDPAPGTPARVERTREGEVVKIGFYQDNELHDPDSHTLAEQNFDSQGMEWAQGYTDGVRNDKFSRFGSNRTPRRGAPCRDAREGLPVEER